MFLVYLVLFGIPTHSGPRGHAPPFRSAWDHACVEQSGYCRNFPSALSILHSIVNGILIVSRGGCPRPHFPIRKRLLISVIGKGNTASSCASPPRRYSRCAEINCISAPPRQYSPSFIHGWGRWITIRMSTCWSAPGVSPTTANAGSTPNPDFSSLSKRFHGFSATAFVTFVPSQHCREKYGSDLCQLAPTLQNAGHLRADPFTADIAETTA